MLEIQRSLVHYGLRCYKLVLFNGLLANKHMWLPNCFEGDRKLEIVTSMAYRKQLCKRFFNVIIDGVRVLLSRSGLLDLGTLYLGNPIVSFN